VIVVLVEEAAEVVEEEEEEEEVNFATISGAEGNIDMMRPYGVLIGQSEVE
jgi:hypothetical protein